MDRRIKKIVVAALLAALVCLATMLFKVPSPMKGYLNLGDGIVLLAGWLLAPAYGFLAAGVGSALADVFSGYIIYAPATFVIKGLMALIAWGVYKLFCNRHKYFPARVIGGVLAEIWMVLGYFAFEGVLYGFVPSLVNIPANGMQGIAGLFIGVLLVRVFGKTFHV